MKLNKGRLGDPNPYRLRLDVSLYWHYSFAVRRRINAPEYLEQSLNSTLNRPVGCSEWLRLRLEQLRTLNGKRFNDHEYSFEIVAEK